MTMTVDYVDAGLAALLDRAAAGEEIILAEAGKPYARLVKLEASTRVPGKRQPGGWPDVTPVSEDAARTEISEAATKLGPRQPGGWPELANIPDSIWFDPLPDDELDAWEGKYSNIL